MVDSDTKEILCIVTREEGAAAGSKRFFTGIPCRNRHISERYVSSGQCVACLLARIPPKGSQEYITRHNRRTINNAVYRTRNRDDIRARNKQNRPKWESTAKKRLRKRLPTEIRVQHAFYLILKQKGLCALCLKYLAGRYHIDHIIPRALGGTDPKKNYQLLCAKCNMAKSALHPVEHARNVGMLL